MIVLNGERSEVAVGETVAAVLARLGLPGDARGIAVSTSTRASWPSFELAEDARVEVLTAMQGG